MNLTRRHFLKSAAALAAAPTFLPASVFGASAPSNRVAMGFVGVGNQGGNHLKQCLADTGVQIVAVCDLDQRHRARAKQQVEAAYAAASPSATWKGLALHHDFRELVTRPDLDAVLVAVPDHWHALIYIAAARAGKDLYAEKPLTHSVEEDYAVIDAVKRYGRVLQAGSHERSGPGCRYAVELVRNGRLGKIHTIEVRLPTDDRIDIGYQPPMPVPPEFDYDFWLGPAPWATYTEKRCHYNFRFINDYAEGEMSNRGAHIADIGLWACAPQLTGPITVEGTGEQYQHSIWDAFYKFNLTVTYASGLRFTITEKGERGLTFFGERGWLRVAIHGGALTASDPALLKEQFGPDEFHLPRSPGHRQDFFNCLKTRGRPIAHVDDAARTSTFCHLCTNAMILGRKFTFDPVTRTCPGDPDATRLLSKPYRAPWVL